MFTFRKLFTFIQDHREKVATILLVIIVLNSIARSSFLQTSLRKVIPRFHTVITNTLPIELAWSYDTREIIKVPPLANSKVIVLLRGDSVLTALDVDTGSTRWEYNLDTNIGLPYSRFVYDLDEETLVIVVNNVELLALDVENGKKIWQRHLASAAKTTPNVMIIGDVAIVSAFSTYPYTEGNVASYKLDNGEFVADIDVPSRSFQYQLSCPPDLGNSNLGEQRICITLFNRLLTINSVEEFKVIDTDIVNLYSLDIPYYQTGFVFSNPSPLPAPQVFDTKQNREFALFAGCSRESTSHPVTSYGDLILISTGCDDLYTMDVHHLEQEPSWIFTSESEIFSSFVTVDGAIGYALNARGEMIGINLATGGEIGRLMTKPDQLERRQFRNSLTVNPPYLYALMDGNTLLAFKQEP